MAFGEILRRHRERLLWSRDELAERAGLSTRAITYLETGRVQRPRGSTVRLLADALALSAEDRATFEQATLPPSEAPPDAGAASPVPRPLSRGPAQLPAGTRDFVGRRRELAELGQFADGFTGRRDAASTTVLICVVSGTAGVGKTALSMHWAHRLRDDYPDGQLFVDLRGFSVEGPRTPDDALARLLHSVGVAPAALPYDLDDRAALYRSTLAGRRMIVVLDNAHSAEQVRHLIPGPGPCLVLITSRSSLGGLEATFGARRLDLDVMTVDEARELLITVIGDRARSQPEATDRLIEQCARLPLALRVAAVLATDRPAESLATLTAELDDVQDRLDVLDADGDPGTAVAGVLSWSYRHLPAESAEMFRLIGLHPGPDLDIWAAGALMDVPLPRARRILRVLEANHLIHQTGTDRFGTHDLLHAYAQRLARRLDGDARCEIVEKRLFTYYADVATQAAGFLSGPAGPSAQVSPDGPGSPVYDLPSARRWLDAERPILANPAFQPPADISIALSRTLWRYLYDGGHTPEAEVVHGRARQAAQLVDDHSGEATALRGLAAAAWRWGRLADAHDLAAQAVKLARAAADEPLLAEALSVAGGISGQQAGYDQAEASFQQALPLYRRHGNARGEASALLSLGILHERRGQPDEAVDHYRRASAISRDIGDDMGRARALHSLGVIAHQRGQDIAGDYYREAIALLADGRNPVLRARALAAQAEEHLRRGRVGAALTANGQALTIFREVGDRVGEGWATVGIAEIHIERKEPEQAMKTFSAALDIFTDTGDQLGAIDCLSGIGDSLRALGRPGEAIERYHQACEVARQVGAPHEVARILAAIADAERQNS